MLKLIDNIAQDRPKDSIYRTDRMDWYNNSLELSKFIDPIEFKNLIRYLNGTNSPELNSYDYPTVLTFFDDLSFQRIIEQYQKPFTVKKLNTLTTGIFTYVVVDKDWVYKKNN